MSDESTESTLSHSDIPSPRQQLEMARIEAEESKNEDSDGAEEPQKETPPKPEEAPQEQEEEALAEPEVSEYVIEGKTYDSKAIQEALVAQANQEAFDKGLQDQLSEMKQVHTALQQKEAALQAREEGVKAQAEQNANFRKYLIQQGQEIDDPVANHLASNVSSSEKVSASSSNTFSPEDIKNLIRQEMAGIKKVDRAENLKTSFIPWIRGALAESGLKEGDPLHTAAYKAIAFDLAEQFESNPDALLQIPDSTIQGWIRQKAGEYGGSIKQRDAKFLSDSVTEAAASGKKMPTTPRVAGTPLPDHSAPTKYRNQSDFAKEIDQLGGLDRWFDETEKRMLATARELEKMERDAR